MGAIRVPIRVPMRVPMSFLENKACKTAASGAAKHKFKVPRDPHGGP